MKRVFSLKRLFLFIIALVIIGVVYSFFQKSESDAVDISTHNTNQESEQPSRSQEGINQLVFTHASSVNDSSSVTSTQLSAEEALKALIKSCGDNLDLSKNLDDEQLMIASETIEKEIKTWKGVEAPRKKLFHFITYAVNGKGSNTYSVEDFLASIESLSSEPSLTPLLDYYVSSFCSLDKYRTACKGNILNSSVNNDQYNGAVWLNLAIRQISLNNEKEAIFALEQIIASPNYDEMWGASLEFLLSNYDNAGIIDLRASTFAAIGITAAVGLPPLQDLFKFCNEQGVSNGQVANLCLEVGKKLSTDSKILIFQQIGYSLQSKIFELNNEMDKKAQVEAEKDRILEAGYKHQGPMMLAYTDNELFRYWYEAMLTFGEIEGNKRFYEEALRLASDPSYSPCQVNKTELH